MTSLSVLYHRIKGASLAWLICPCKRPLPPEFVKSSGWRSVVLARLWPLGWLEQATKLAWRTTAETWPATGIACAEQSCRLLWGMFVLKAQRACWLLQWWRGCGISKRANLWCEHPDLFRRRRAQVEHCPGCTREPGGIFYMRQWVIYI